MVKFYNYDIVFAEIPNEVTLAVNISGCPNRCPGCHSAHLQQNIGTELNVEAIETLLNLYEGAITCFCFMGGDGCPDKVNSLAKHLRCTHPNLKIGWYSGKDTLVEIIDIANFDYIKIGPWIESRGPLSSPTTNQRIFQILPSREMLDITFKMQKK